MVDRDLYKQDVDFAALALRYPDFNKHLKTNGQLDFSNPEAVQSLTKGLLKRDFGLELELPEDRLCPPVPNRFNYILWLQDLIDSTSEDYNETYDTKREVVGQDIGAGASCIYALLGCATRPQWKFVVTEIDPKNMDFAKRNIISNNLKSRIRPIQRSLDDVLIPLGRMGVPSIDFTMCNPPFYSSTADLLASASAKARPPHSACTGADVEMVTEGGEVAFVSRMIEESKNLGTRCQWYTSMLGKASSVEMVVKKIKETGVDNWVVKDLVQGSKTKRWVVGWSWSSLRPSDKVARAIATLPKHLLPFPSSFEIFATEPNIDIVAQRLNDTMQQLDVRWQYKTALATGVGFARGNVWSRAARRKKERGSPVLENLHLDPVEPGLVVKVKLSVLQEGGVSLNVRWLQGRDAVLFESFCGMLKRQINTTTS